MIRSATVAPPRTTSPRRPDDDLKDWADLTSVQRGLFAGEVGGARTYEALSYEQRAIFLLITTRLANDGIDLSGLRLENPKKTIRPNRILFAQGPALDRFKAQLTRAKGDDLFLDDHPFPLFHYGRSSFGARENTAKWSVQIGIGSGGAFADVDRFNPWAGTKAFLGHTLELLVPGKPDADDVARGLDLPVFDAVG